MDIEKDEAGAIARLIGTDGEKIVGWVYRWNTGELAVRWIDGPRHVSGIEPDLIDDVPLEIDLDSLVKG